MLLVNLPLFGFYGLVPLSQNSAKGHSGYGNAQRGGFNSSQGSGYPGGSFGAGMSQNQRLGGLGPHSSQAGGM